MIGYLGCLYLVDFSLQLGKRIAGKLFTGMWIGGAQDHQSLDEDVIIEDPFSALEGILTHSEFNLMASLAEHRDFDFSLEMHFELIDLFKDDGLQLVLELLTLALIEEKAINHDYVG